MLCAVPHGKVGLVAGSEYASPDIATIWASNSNGVVSVSGVGFLKGLHRAEIFVLDEDFIVEEHGMAKASPEDPKRGSRSWRARVSDRSRNRGA